jgi:hypothetical protein
MNSDSGDPAHAFCLARVKQSDWTYTVVHEWGHNMGCSHSKTQVIQKWDSGDFKPYSAGWQWLDTKPSSPKIGYCSVMTYEDHNNDGTREYERAPHFSNPDIDYTGDSTNPTGDAADGDNAKTMRDMKGIYANYEQPPPTPPVIETAPTSLALAADRTAADKTDSVSLVISNSGESTLSFLITDGTQADTYTWADSNDTGGPTFDWVDISSTFTGSVSLEEEGESSMLDIGFSFPFYGNSYTQFQIAANGVISFEARNVYSVNDPLPASINHAPESFVAPFWDDLGNFRASTHHYRREPGRVVVSYPAISVSGDESNPTTFLMILY